MPDGISLNGGVTWKLNEISVLEAAIGYLQQNNQSGLGNTGAYTFGLSGTWTGYAPLTIRPNISRTINQSALSNYSAYVSTLIGVDFNYIVHDAWTMVGGLSYNTADYTPVIGSGAACPDRHLHARPDRLAVHASAPDPDRPHVRIFYGLFDRSDQRSVVSATSLLRQIDCKALTMFFRKTSALPIVSAACRGWQGCRPPWSRQWRWPAATRAPPASRSFPFRPTASRRRSRRHRRPTGRRRSRPTNAARDAVTTGWAPAIRSASSSCRTPRFSGDYEVNGTGAISVRVLGPIQGRGHEPPGAGGYAARNVIGRAAIWSRRDSAWNLLPVGRSTIVGEVTRPGSSRTLHACM